MLQYSVVWLTQSFCLKPFYFSWHNCIIFTSSRKEAKSVVQVIHMCSGFWKGKFWFLIQCYFSKAKPLPIQEEIIFYENICSWLPLQQCILKYPLWLILQQQKEARNCFRQHESMEHDKKTFKGDVIRL